MRLNILKVHPGKIPRFAVPLVLVVLPMALTPWDGVSYALESEL